MALGSRFWVLGSRFKVLGSGFRGSGFSPAAGQKNGQFDRKRNSEKANIE
jgi:hypothetical protein